MNSTEITLLTEAPAQADFLAAVETERGADHWHRLAGFLRDAAAGARDVWIARQDNQICGMVTIRWRSDYRGFCMAPPAPEIVDLYVWEDHRRQGLATRLLQTVENAARAKGYRRIGLGVGILADDAAAWPLYLKQGYRFDGTGSWWRGELVMPYTRIDQVLDPVLLMMEKTL